MVRKKIKFKSIKLISIILLISLSIISYSKLFQKQSLYDDIIFFINQGKSNKKQTAKESNLKNNIQETYMFDVMYNGTNSKKINLFNSLNVNTLANGKIAPGISGTFEIIICSNINTQYKIEFQSLNEKPKNMKFWTKDYENKYYDLEKLSDNLRGKIKGYENKKIKINWEWEYENNHEENIQDTIDAKNIQKYNFNIYVTGKSGE